jgi:hypothetical protein
MLISSIFFSITPPTLPSAWAATAQVDPPQRARPGKSPTEVGSVAASTWGLPDRHGNEHEKRLLRGGRPVNADDFGGLRVVCLPESPSLKP